MQLLDNNETIIIKLAGICILKYNLPFTFFWLSYFFLFSQLKIVSKASLKFLSNLLRKKNWSRVKQDRESDLTFETRDIGHQAHVSDCKWKSKNYFYLVLF